MNYYKNIPSNNYINVYDTNTDEEFASILNDMDLLVQLRVKSNGESSGVITTAINLNKPCVVTDSHIDHENKKSFITVPNDTNYIMLAEIIYKIAT